MTAPPTFDEVAARLKLAADTELLAINQLELEASRASVVAPELYRLTVGEARRQAEALGFAHRVMLQLAAQPDISRILGLGRPLTGGAA
ncbi:MAG: hypothetical protein GY873_30245 [Bosea sp.]|uniref:hypothetical protein n=1 Tax=Bosea sp. (in: a-proteobacteria) TaxID=1871050 RepID=UPI002390ED41|nr:hypothetical protein [Bosea sp. (in: a-proteobacteria)]MCP4738477.1 hypothetical protein [Bosea sp. (in: a-proteobacteria)]